MLLVALEELEIQDHSLVEEHQPVHFQQSNHKLFYENDISKTIIKNLLKKDVEHSYLTKNFNFNQQTWEDTINCYLTFCGKYDLTPEVKQIGIKLFQRVFDGSEVCGKEQPFALMCLFIACKYDNPNEVITLIDILSHLNFVWSQEQLLLFELQILNKINYRIWGCCEWELSNLLLF